LFCCDSQNYLKKIKKRLKVSVGKTSLLVIGDKNRYWWFIA